MTKLADYYIADYIFRLLDITNVISKIKLL
jgi:hypothetical protein